MPQDFAFELPDSRSRWQMEREAFSREPLRAKAGPFIEGGAISPFWWRKQLIEMRVKATPLITRAVPFRLSLSLSSSFLFLYLIKLRVLILFPFYFLSSSLYFYYDTRYIGREHVLYFHMLVIKKSEPRPDRNNRLLSNKPHLHTSSVTYFLWEKDTKKPNVLPLPNVHTPLGFTYKFPTLSKLQISKWYVVE